MSTEIAVIRHEVVEAVKQPTLEALPELIRSELSSAATAFRVSVDHAIAAGEYLLMAKALVPRGQWRMWLAENLPEAPTPAIYMRLARHSNEIREQGHTTIRDAWRSLRGIQSGARIVDPQEAKNLRSQGWTNAQIGDYFGVTRSAIYRVFEPKRNAEQKAKRRVASMERWQAEQAEKIRKRDAAVKRRGDNTAHAYSFIRRAVQLLDASMAEHSEPDAKRSITAAIHSLHNAEDRIGHAIRNEYHRSLTGAARLGYGEYGEQSKRVTDA